MRFTLIFGAPVHANESQLGKLSRIIVNNGIANQITVDPGFLGTERVVPINVFRQSDDEALTLELGADDWKAFPSYTMDQGLGNPNESTPDLSVLTPEFTRTQQVPDTSHPLSAGLTTERRTVDELSVVLTSSTAVVDDTAPDTQHKLRGMTIDTGRPQELLLEDGRMVAYSAVTMLDENRIHVGGLHQQPLLASDRGYEQTRANDPVGDQRR